MIGMTESIVAVQIDNMRVAPHELTVVTETRPVCLAPATLAERNGTKTLLYACDGLVPIAYYGERRGDVTLSILFALLTGYVKTLLTARDLLLDTALLSSDPENGVFVCGGEKAAEAPVLKALWGADAVFSDNEKICRIAASLAKRERVMGACASMERMIEILRQENLSLRACLKLAESLCREWNGISGKAFS
jgi:hypothetical protein